MTDTRYRINRCGCGAVPEVKDDRAAEDAVETWVECGSCGAKGGVTEDAYADPAKAVMSWNAGDRERRGW